MELSSSFLALAADVHATNYNYYKTRSCSLSGGLNLNLNLVEPNSGTSTTTHETMSTSTVQDPPLPLPTGDFQSFGDHDIQQLNQQNEESEKAPDQDLAEQLNKMSKENKRLTERLSVMHENFDNIKNMFLQYVMMKKNSNNHSNSTQSQCYKDDQEINALKRKVADSIEHGMGYNSPGDPYRQCPAGMTNQLESAAYAFWKRPRIINLKPKTSKVYIRIQKSDTTLVVKDGYQWRKYGQKVTRDNPSPRAYFKCSFAPICPVKKKVQRSAENPQTLVATYEGEHNHIQPSGSSSDQFVPLPSIHSNNIMTDSPKSKLSTITNPYDLLQQLRASSRENSENRQTLQRLLVEQMASSLTSDPSFTAALAATTSGKMLETSRSERRL